MRVPTASFTLSIATVRLRWEPRKPPIIRAFPNPQLHYEYKTTINEHRSRRTRSSAAGTDAARENSVPAWRSVDAWSHAGPRTQPGMFSLRLWRTSRASNVILPLHSALFRFVSMQREACVFPWSPPTYRDTPTFKTMYEQVRGGKLPQSKARDSATQRARNGRHQASNNADWLPNC